MDTRGCRAWEPQQRRARTAGFCLHESVLINGFVDGFNLPVMAEPGRIRIIGGSLDGESVAVPDVLRADGGLPEIVEFGDVNYYWFARIGRPVAELVLAPGPEPPTDFRPLRLSGRVRPSGEWKGWPL